jgi:membrane-associated phospholipid phosphatase
LDSTLSLSLRLAILVLCTLLWLVAYFFINRLQVEPQRRKNFSFSVDRKIPYVPLFAIVYFSTVPFLFVPFVILSETRQFCWMVACYTAITVISSLIHATLPSKIERVEQVNTGGITGRMLRLFQKNFKPYGNFPSMHVGLSVPAVIAYFMGCGILAGSIAAVWAVLIALSTLFAKQHYILDILAGLAGGILIAALAYLLILV